MLYGRESETAQLAGMLEAARSGQPAALVIRGEAGIGKSALLEALAASAAGVQVLRTQGVESELPLAFAGLFQLLQPLFPLLDQLPAPQARALRVAFGQEQGAVIEPFLVALATLALLAAAAVRSPVLCLVDDAHWLDVASADALLFAARRLQADPVVLVFTVREGDARPFTPAGVPALVLGGLDPSAARALLAGQRGTPLADVVSEMLVEQTGGNPLALVELPTALTASQLDGTAPMPAQLQLTDVVQRVFLDRCRRLSEQVQTLLLVAAADDSGRLAVVMQAAQMLGVDALALQEAEEARLLVTDRDTIRVRHPLVRSAVYQAATGQERRAAHRALAQSLTAVQDTDRRAWHWAASVDGPDEAVAAALEGAAERAEQRGGFLAAAAGYERAAELTVDEQVRAARLFGAARNAWAYGEADRARNLAEAARASADDRLLRADIDRLRARIEVNVGSAASAHRMLVNAARAVAADDPSRALEMRVAATLTSLYVTESDALSSLEGDELHTRAQPDDVPRTRCLRHLLTATTAAAAERWEAAMHALVAAVDASSEVQDLDVLGNLGNTALYLGDGAAHGKCFARMVQEARDRGAGMALLYALARLPFSTFPGGRWASVREGAEEALRLSANTGQPSLGAAPLAWLTLLSAVQGRSDYETLRSRLDLAMQEHLGVLTDPVHDLCRWSAGVRAMQQGNTAEAVHDLGKIRVPVIARMAAYDRLDAAVRAGENKVAHAWLGEIADFAGTSQWPWALAASDYGRALLAEPADAPDLFDRSLAHHAGADRPYDEARTRLAYGELLRRGQRRVDARPHLRAALVIFQDLHAQPFADRAAQELRASGETARKRDPSTLVALTPMELQVTNLVAQGLSNKDVATQLWISPRTVAFHLRGAFAKLQVSSRGELAQLRLAERTSASEVTAS